MCSHYVVSAGNYDPGDFGAYRLDIRTAAQGAIAVRPLNRGTAAAVQAA